MTINAKRTQQPQPTSLYFSQVQAAGTQEKKYVIAASLNSHLLCARQQSCHWQGPTVSVGATAALREPTGAHSADRGALAS